MVAGRLTFRRSQELDAVSTPLLTELRSEYVVGYASTNRKRSNDKRRKLRVEIATGEKGESRMGVVREYFIAPKN